MGDTLVECSIKRKPGAKHFAILALAIAFMVVAFAFFVFYFRNGIMFLVGIILCAVISKITASGDEEYEYIFLNGDIDFARIVNKSKRTELLTVSMQEVELVAPKGSEKLRPYENAPKERFQVLDYSSLKADHKDRMYEMICKAENKSYRIIFEPNEKMLEAMWLASPRTVVK